MYREPHVRPRQYALLALRDDEVAQNFVLAPELDRHLAQRRCGFIQCDAYRLRAAPRVQQGLHGIGATEFIFRRRAPSTVIPFDDVPARQRQRHHLPRLGYQRTAREGRDGGRRGGGGGGGGGGRRGARRRGAPRGRRRRAAGRGRGGV